MVQHLEVYMKAKNSEIQPSKFAAFQLKSENPHLNDGNGNKCGIGNVCQLTAQY